MANKTSNEPREITKRDEKDSPDENEESVTLSDEKDSPDEKEESVTRSDEKDSPDENEESVTLSGSITKTMKGLAISVQEEEEQEQDEQEQEQEQEDSELTPISIITSNVGRPFGESPPVDDRKNGIAGLLTKEKPDIVFFQEFPWVDLQILRIEENIPAQYEYSGRKGTSILYNGNRIIVPHQNGILPADVQLSQYLREFTQDQVLHILKIKISSAQYLCVSWHCPHSDNAKEKLQKLRKMLDIVVQISNSTSLPFIIAGDFNISFIDVQKFITENSYNMRIYDYHPQERRRTKPKIDFFISSMSATLSNVRSINWDDLATDAKATFDHDPVKATLSLQKKSSASNEQLTDQNADQSALS